MVKFNGMRGNETPPIRQVDTPSQAQLLQHRHQHQQPIAAVPEEVPTIATNQGSALVPRVIILMHEGIVQDILTDVPIQSLIFDVTRYNTTAEYCTPYTLREGNAATVDDFVERHDGAIE